ncbi:Crp/Fnr family transcriptional regulator [uncultured Flavobacterium sp.]|uniref:Crp/Fnr family transcriptional regulator n=1 Tax=uncultured Flavobacterium sp. TaxID=165435 RepID=UPI00292FE12A|nr:Crp/Fnr family transcriptional regulator [uncultured Flavobacterium sp.]
MEFLNNLETKNVSKGTILLHQGDLCKAVYKVVKGCLKSYVTDNTGKEHILQFAPEEWQISDLDSFLNDKPTAVFIEAIEDSEIIILSKDFLLNYKSFDRPALVELNNKLLHNIIATNRRLIALLTVSAEERYIDFTQTYPNLVQRLSLKLIASYIGITPEYLSEIRRKIVHK